MGDIDYTPSEAANKIGIAADQVPGSPDRFYPYVKIVDGTVGGTEPVGRLRGLDVRPSAVSRDAFARFRFSSPRALLDGRFLYDKSTVFWDELLTNTSALASSTFNPPSVVMTVGGSGDVIVRQTFQRFSGRAVQAFFAGIFPTRASTKKRVGLFDENNGAFLENDGTTLNLTTRKGGVDIGVTRASWSVDALDGTGPSGVSLDLTKVQVFFLDFDWLGTGTIRFGFVVDGELLLAHEAKFANVSVLSWANSPSLPARFEHTSTGGQGPMTQLACAVFAEGERNPGVSKTKDVGGTALSLAAAGTKYAFLGITLHATNLDGIVDDLVAELASTTATAAFRWSLHLNPTVTGGTFSYGQLTGTLVDAAVGDGTAAVTVDGTVLASGVGIGSAAREIRTGLRLGASIAGLADKIVLAVTPISAGASYVGSLGWKEF